MIHAQENKRLTGDETALVRALLESPLAEEMRRSMNFNAKAIRDWAANTALEALKANRGPIIARLNEQAKAASERRDQLRREYDAAEFAANKAGAAAQDAQAYLAQRRNSLRQIASARDSWLEEKGVLTIEDALKFVGGL